MLANKIPVQTFYMIKLAALGPAKKDLPPQCLYWFLRWEDLDALTRPSSTLKPDSRASSDDPNRGANTRTHSRFKMILNPLTHIAPTIPAVAANAAFKPPTAALVARGGAAATAAVFDAGLANTRLEGLAYSTVTTLMMSASMTLFSATPKNLESIPDDGEKAKVARFVSLLCILFVYPSTKITKTKNYLLSMIFVYII